MVSTNFLYPSASRIDLFRVEPSSSQRNLTMRHEFLKTILAKLSKRSKTNVNGSVEGDIKTNVSGWMKPETIESLLFENLYKLLLSKYDPMLENSTATTRHTINSITAANDITDKTEAEGIMKTTRSTNELREHQKAELDTGLDMRIHVRPTFVAAANKTFAPRNFSKSRSAEGETNIFQNAFEEYQDISAFDSQKNGNNLIIADVYEQRPDTFDGEIEVEPATSAYEEDIYEEDVGMPHFVTELPLKVPATFTQSLLEKSTLKTPEEILERVLEATRKDDEKSPQTLDFSSNIEHRHGMFESQELNFKYHPKAISLRSPTGERVTLVKHPTHFIDKYHKSLGITTQKRPQSHVSQTKQDISLIRNEVNDELPQKTEKLHNLTIFIDSVDGTEFLRRGEGKSSIAVNSENLPSSQAAAPFQISRDALKPNTLETLKHGIVKYVIGRRRFPKKKNDGAARTRSMAVEEEIKQNLEFFGKTRMADSGKKQTAAGEAYSVHG